MSKAITFCMKDLSSVSKPPMQEAERHTLLEMLDLIKFGVTVHAPILRLWPSLQAGDTLLLNEAQRERLNQVLMSHDVPCGELKGLQQVGDKQALPLYSLIAERGWGQRADRCRQRRCNACLCCKSE